MTKQADQPSVQLPTVSLLELFQAGVHFGHSTSRWHPAMAPYIHSKQAGRYLIDLNQTLTALKVVADLIIRRVGAGDQIMFISTKRQARQIVMTTALKLSMPYVTERWMGGMLTNQKTIRIQVDKLKDLEARMVSGELVSKYNKLEVQNLQKQIDSLNQVYGGIKELATRPGLVFVVDPISNAIAVAEARKLSIPVIAMIDTNSDPGSVDYPIYGNDDAIKSIELIVDFISQAVEAGLAERERLRALAPEPGPDRPAPAKADPDGRVDPALAPARDSARAVG